MTFSWQNAELPISAGEGINWKHFESIRKLVWLSWLGLDAGADPDYLTTDNPEAVTDTGWAAYAGGIGSLPYPYGVYAGELNELVYICTVGGETIADVYGNYVEMSRTVLIANPPVFADGTFNSAKWRKVASFNYYHDWDKNSGRYFVRSNTNGMGGTRYLTDMPAHTFLPKQVDPKWQLNRVKYDDTERKICKRKYLEIDRSHITQLATMGPKYYFIWYYDQEWFRRKKSGFSDVTFPDYGGQYTHDHPEPALGSGYNRNRKLCDAYQSAVEHILSLGQWYVKVSEGTAWGQAYIANWAGMYPTADWDSETPYTASIDTKVKYGGKVWICIKSNTGQAPTEYTPIYEGYWRPYLITDGTSGLPDYAPADDELWGCNCSSFELALWMYGKHDWYFEPSMSYVPIAYSTGVLYLRAYAASEGANSTQIDAAYPLPIAGTWRRCFRHTLGPLGTVMMPGESDPINQTYSTFQDFSAFDGMDPPLEVESCWWPGIFRAENAGYTLEGADEILIAKRHDPALTVDSNEYYEIVVEILNDMWALLGILNLASSGITIGVESAQLTASGDTYTGETVRSVMQACYAAALAKSPSWEVGLPELTQFAGTLQIWYEDKFYVLWFHAHRQRFTLTGGYRKGRYTSSSVSLLLGYRDSWPPMNPSSGVKFGTKLEMSVVGEVIAGQTSAYPAYPYPSSLAYPYKGKLLNFPIPDFEPGHVYTHECVFGIDWSYIPATPAPDPYPAFELFWGVEQAINQKLCGDNLVLCQLSFDMAEPRRAIVFDSIRDWNFSAIAIDDELFDDDGFFGRIKLPA